MHQLVYISTARDKVSPEMIREILRVSQTNNARVRVTGLLVAGANRFLQVLEGPSREVSQTYERIRADERHFACVLLTSRSIAARSFGEWSMGFQQGGRVSDRSLREVVHGLTATLEDKGLQAEFRSFAELHDRAA